jgi:hypothetical protein
VYRVISWSRNVTPRLCVTLPFIWEYTTETSLAFFLRWQQLLLGSESTQLRDLMVHASCSSCSSRLQLPFMLYAHMWSVFQGWLLQEKEHCRCVRDGLLSYQVKPGTLQKYWQRQEEIQIGNARNYKMWKKKQCDTIRAGLQVVGVVLKWKVSGRKVSGWDMCSCFYWPAFISNAEQSTFQ